VLTSVRAVIRLLRVVLHLVSGLLTIWWYFPRLTLEQKEMRVQHWARGMLSRLAIDIEVRGNVPTHGPMLLVANHISWLDILVMHSACACRFISKSDIRKWPMIGGMASAAGTLFIERASRRDAMRVVHTMAECLGESQVLAIFPEGTTGDGTHVLPFHGNLIQAAIVTQAPVQPVGLRFIDATTLQNSIAPCYIGDETLVTSLWRTASTDNLRAVVHFGTPQLPMGRERRQWAEDLRESIIALRE